MITAPPRIILNLGVLLMVVVQASCPAQEYEMIVVSNIKYQVGSTYDLAGAISLRAQDMKMALIDYGFLHNQSSAYHSTYKAPRLDSSTGFASSGTISASMDGAVDFSLDIDFGGIFYYVHQLILKKRACCNYYDFLIELIQIEFYDGSNWLQYDNGAMIATGQLVEDVFEKERSIDFTLIKATKVRFISPASGRPSNVAVGRLDFMLTPACSEAQFSASSGLPASASIDQSNGQLSASAAFTSTVVFSMQVNTETVTSNAVTVESFDCTPSITFSNVPSELKVQILSNFEGIVVMAVSSSSDCIVDTNSFQVTSTQSAVSMGLDGSLTIDTSLAFESTPFQVSVKVGSQTIVSPIFRIQVIDCSPSGEGDISEGAYSGSYSNEQYVDKNQDSTQSTPTRFVLPAGPDTICGAITLSLSSSNTAVVPLAANTVTIQNKIHDPSKCLQSGNFDNDCCGKSTRTSCLDSYVLTLGAECYTYGDGTFANSFTCSHPDDTGYVVPVDLSLKQAINFYIFYESAGGQFTYSSIKSLVVGCPASIASVTIGSYADASLNDTQYVQAGNTDGTTQFVLPAIALSTPSEFCTSFTFAIKDMNGAAHSQLKDDSIASEGKIYPTDNTLDGDYKFKVEILLDGIQVALSGESQLVVGCPDDFVTISEAAYTDSSLSDIQYVDKNDLGTQDTRFVLPQITFTSVLTYCTSFSYVAKPSLSATTLSQGSAGQFLDDAVGGNSAIFVQWGYCQTTNYLCLGNDVTTIDECAERVVNNGGKFIVWGVPKQGQCNCYDEQRVGEDCPVGFTQGDTYWQTYKFANSGVSYIVPTDKTLDAKYTFYIEFVAGTLGAFYSSQKQLFVGCPAEVVTIAIQGFLDSSNTDVQYVDMNDADSSKLTRFTLPVIQVTSPASYCSATWSAKPSLVSGLLDQGTAGSFLNDAVSSSSNLVIVPQDLSTQTKYEFYIEITAGTTVLYSPLETLFVGCPAEIVTITEGAYPPSYSNIQYVEKNDIYSAKLTRFVFQEFVVTSPASHCSTIQTAKATLQSNSLDQGSAGTFLDSSISGADYVAVPQDKTAETKYEFYIEVVIGLATYYTAKRTLYVGCPEEIVTITQEPYLDTTNSDIQYVDFNDKNSIQLTQFILPEFKIAPTAWYCKIDTVKPTLLLNSLDQGTVGTFLDDAIVSGPNRVVVPQDKSAQTKYEFYIQVAGGLSTIYSSLMTLYVGCPEDIVTITQGQFTDPANNSTQYVDIDDRDPKNLTYFVLPSFQITTLASHCAILQTLKPSTSNRLLDQGISGSYLANAVTNGSDYVIVPESKSSQKTYEFYVELTIGVRVAWSTKQTLVVGCPEEIISITRGDFPSLVYSETQIVQQSDLDPSRPTRFVLPLVTTASPSSYCTTFTAKAVMSSLATTETLEDALEEQDGMLAFRPSNISAQVAYRFNIEVKSGLRSEVNSTLMTFVVGCPDELEIKITEGAYPVIEGSPSNFTDIQYVNIAGNSTVPTRFILPSYASSSAIPHCGVNQSDIKVSSNYTLLEVDTPGSFLTNAKEILNGTMGVEPQNMGIHKEYLFYLQVQAGQELVFSSRKQLVVGCTPSIGAEHLMMNQSRSIGIKKDAIVFITIPILNRTYCKVEQIQLVDIKTDLKLSTQTLKFDPACAEDPCIFLSVDNTDAARSITFKIQYLLTGEVEVMSPYETELVFVEEANFPPRFRATEGSLGKIEVKTSSQAKSVVEFEFPEIIDENPFDTHKVEIVDPLPCMSISTEVPYVLSIDQSQIKEEEGGSYTLQVKLIEIKGKYSKFAGTFAEYSLDLDVIAAPVENKTEAVVEEVIEEPEETDTNPTEEVLDEEILNEVLKQYSGEITLDEEELREITTIEPIEEPEETIVGSGVEEIEEKLPENVQRVSADFFANAWKQALVETRLEEKVQKKKGKLEGVKEKKKVVKPKALEVEVPDMSRDGSMACKFSGRLQVPSFITKNKEEKKRRMQEEDEMYKNGTYHPKRPRRKLVALEELDINRDLMKVKFFLKSDIKVEDIEYFLSVGDWTPTNFTIVVTFKSPMIISQGIIRDEMEMSIKNPYLFVSEETGKMIDVSKLKFYQTLPRQLPKGIIEQEEKESAGGAKDGSTALIIVQIILQSFLKGNMSDMIACVFTIQICCFFTFYAASMPGNVDIYLEEFRKLIEFEMADPDNILALINPNWKVKNLMGLGQERLTNTIESSGVTTSNAAYNLKIFVFIFGAILIVGLVPIIFYVIKGFRPIIERRMRNNLKKVYYNGIIGGQTVSYLKAGVAFGTSLQVLNWDQSFWSLQPTILPLVYMILFPTVCLAVLVNNKKNLDDPRVKARISLLYAGIDRKKTQYAVYWYPIWIFRRMFFVLIPVCLQDYPALQIMFLVYMSVAYAMYYSGNRPHAKRQQVMIEAGNEILMIMLMYHLFCFTGFVQSKEIQFGIGWSFLGVMILILAWNIQFMVKSSYRTAILRRMQEANQLAYKRAFQDYQQRIFIKKKIGRGLKKVFRARKAKKVKTIFDEFKSDYKIEEGADHQLQLKRKRTFQDRTRKMSNAAGGKTKTKVPQLSIIQEEALEESNNFSHKFSSASEQHDLSNIVVLSLKSTDGLPIVQNISSIDLEPENEGFSCAFKGCRVFAPHYHNVNGDALPMHQPHYNNAASSLDILPVLSPLEALEKQFDSELQQKLRAIEKPLKMMEDLRVDDDNIPQKIDEVRKEVWKIISRKEYKEAKQMFKNSTQKSVNLFTNLQIDGHSRKDTRQIDIDLCVFTIALCNKERQFRKEVALLKGPLSAKAATRPKNNQVKPIRIQNQDASENLQLEKYLERLKDMPLQDPREEKLPPSHGKTGLNNLFDQNLTFEIEMPKIINKGRVIPVTNEQLDQIRGADYLDENKKFEGLEGIGLLMFQAQVIADDMLYVVQKDAVMKELVAEDAANAYMDKFKDEPNEDEEEGENEEF